MTIETEVAELRAELAALRAEYEAHRHIVPSDDGFVNRSAPPDTDERGRRAVPVVVEEVPRCAICGSAGFDVMHTDGVGLREAQPWEGGTIAHRGCVADAIRERARDADLNA